ncbi:MAG: 3-oxoacyl-[acyl-carrier-protein] reductase [Candidatus Latescibacterota bacterium]
MFDLEGKSALVTGASGGIGGAIARALHSAGANVALSGTREEPLNTLASELGENAHVTPADLLDAKSVEGLIGLVEEVIGGVDILVNNAGLTRDMLSMRLTDDDWQSVVDVNLTATFRLSRAVIRGMMKRRWGRIINISSVVGVTGNAGQANYAASKAGMIGMSKSIAQEVASRGITVNCVAPGMIVTAMTDVLSDNQKARILDMVPAGRLGESEEIAAGVVYLASEEASYVTGQTIHINGGMAMV